METTSDHDTLKQSLSVDAERWTLGNERGSSQMSETGPQSLSSQPTFDDPCHGEPEAHDRDKFFAVFVHHKDEGQVAYEVKKEIENYIQNPDVELELYGDVKSTPVFGILEEICRRFHKIILLWTPKFEQDKQCLEMSQTLKVVKCDTSVLDMIIICHGFNENRKPNNDNIALKDTIPVVYSDTEYFFETMKKRLCVNRQRTTFPRQGASVEMPPVRNSSQNPESGSIQSEALGKDETVGKRVCDDALPTDVQSDSTSRSLPTYAASIPTRCMLVSASSQKNEMESNEKSDVKHNISAVDSTIPEPTQAKDQTEGNTDKTSTPSPAFPQLSADSKETEKSEESPETNITTLQVKVKDYGQVNEYRQREHLRSQGACKPIQSDVLQCGQVGTRDKVSQKLQGAPDVTKHPEEPEEKPEESCVETHSENHSEKDVSGAETHGLPSEREAPVVQSAMGVSKPSSISGSFSCRTTKPKPLQNSDDSQAMYPWHEPLSDPAQTAEDAHVAPEDPESEETDLKSSACFRTDKETNDTAIHETRSDTGAQIPAPQTVSLDTGRQQITEETTCSPDDLPFIDSDLSDSSKNDDKSGVISKSATKKFQKREPDHGRKNLPNRCMSSEISQHWPTAVCIPVQGSQALETLPPAMAPAVSAEDTHMTHSDDHQMDNVQTQASMTSAPLSSANSKPVHPNQTVYNIAKVKTFYISASGSQQAPVQPVSDSSATSQTLDTATLRLGSAQDLTMNDPQPDSEETPGHCRRDSERSNILRFLCCGLRKKKKANKRSGGRKATE